MKFWDTSAVVPLTVGEPRSPQMLGLLRHDSDQTVWWRTRTECVSALARRTRQGTLTGRGEAQARVALQQLIASWDEVQPTLWVRAVAEVLLDHYPLKAADAMQLAAAVAWSSGQPQGREFVCLDRQLRAAAGAVGFTVLP